MSDPMTRGRMSAWQRWEMDSFNEPNQPKQARLSPEQQAAAEQLRAAMEEGRQMGLAQGRAEGLELGRKDGYREGQQAAQREAQKLQALANAFNDDVQRVHQDMSGELLALALDVAKAMLKTSLAVTPELVLPVIENAIQELGVVAQPAQLVLHPSDAELVRQHLGEELARGNWRIREDSALAPGGCLLETASNHVDASIETRWQRLAAALQGQGEWLA
jgi:flagellar assembly protein FliH